MRLAACLLCAAVALFAQRFDVASVKPSAQPVGPDYNNQVTLGPSSFSGKNVTLKRLIMEAYGLLPHQVVGPKWLNDLEFDVEAKAAQPAPKAQLRAMLQALLADRFHLAFHRESKEMRVYEVLVDRAGPKIHADSTAPPQPGFEHFHGEMPQFANLLSFKLAMPIADDPSKPAIASAPSPVVDSTGLAGTYDFNFQVKLELGVDPVSLWQRILQEQLGLKLETRKGPVELLVVDSAERTPTVN